MDRPGPSLMTGPAATGWPWAGAADTGDSGPGRRCGPQGSWRAS